MAEPVAIQVAEFLESSNNRCFACGPSNPHGLHIHPRREGDLVVADFAPTEWHEGWSRVIHGGILATLMDEVMAYTLLLDGLEAVTARLETRFRAGVQKGDRLRIEGRLINRRRAIADAESRVRRDGEVVAEASARFMVLGTLKPGTL
jgi:acyl-coenzyme A thioesterase PaaI-like protein